VGRVALAALDREATLLRDRTVVMASRVVVALAWLNHWPMLRR